MRNGSSYAKLKADGLVEEETEVDPDDVIMARLLHCFSRSKWS